VAGVIDLAVALVIGHLAALLVVAVRMSARDSHT
jgi:hypothetical protein